MIATIILGFLGGLGGGELVMIAAVVLLMFGGKKIPEMMKGLGKGMREFKDATAGVTPVEEKVVKTEEK